MDYDLAEEDLRMDATGPTFEDLAIDDSLSDLDRITKYICSNIALQRVIHVKMLADTAISVGVQATCDHLIPLLEPLVCDLEYVVRQHVALQFPPLCAFLVAKTHPSAQRDLGYRVLLEKLVPLMAQLVSDKQHEVRSAASESLVAMAAHVHPEDQGPHILTIVLPLAHDDDNEQFRISAVSLYHGLAPHLGPELCQQFCVPELVSLSEDPVFRVRKSTAQSFASVCKTAGPELSRERLLPSFQRLAHDDIWAVRKACAESLVSVSESLAPIDRGELLIPLVEHALSDSTRWVRLAAFQNLGPFLASLERSSVTDELLQHFMGMATNAVAAQLGGSGEVDMRFHCAFNLPAVVSILGRSDWSRLAPTFEILRQDAFWKIRRTLAYSLHELARMLGPELTEAHLAPAFDAYLRDVPEVKMGVILHFSDFVGRMRAPGRDAYLPVLQELLLGLSDQTNWRIREIVSLQLPQLGRIFRGDARFDVILPLLLTLLTDEVAVVRHQSVRAVPLLVARLVGRDDWRDDVVQRFVALSESCRFTDRQVFLRICETFLTGHSGDVTADDTGSDAAEDTAEDGAANEPIADVSSFFAMHLAEAFFSLATDSVSNVRLVCVEVMLAHRAVLQDMTPCPAAISEVLRDVASGGESESVTASDVLVKLAERMPPQPKKPVAKLQEAAVSELKDGVEEKSTGDTVEDPKVEVNVEDLKPEVKTEEAKTDDTAEDTMTDDSAEDTKTDDKSEEMKADTACNDRGDEKFNGSTESSVKAPAIDGVDAGDIALTIEAVKQQVATS